jgi:hypothetical protein
VPLLLCVKVLFYSFEELLFEFVFLSFVAYLDLCSYVSLFFFYYSILLCFKILRGNVGEKSRGGEREREREREMG